MSQVETLKDIYFHAVEAGRGKFRYKSGGSFRDQSIEEFGVIGSEIALGLISLGLKVGDRVAVLSETRLEWSQADMGILTAGLVSVPVYPTLPPASVEYLLENSGARVLLVSNLDQASKAVEYRKAHPDLEIVIFDFDTGGEDGFMSLDDLRERGRKLGEAEPDLLPRRAEGLGPDDLATIIYTSGTTGTPKGVMLAHGNITSNVLASLKVLPLRSDDTCLSFLPLSHIFERMAGLYAMLYSGVTIAYAESIDTVPQNLLEVRPTVVVGVPRFYEKMYARVMDAATQGGSVKKNLFFWARSVGLRRGEAIREGDSPGLALDLQYHAAKMLVFRKLKQRTGGRLRFFVSGGAPLPKDIAEFFAAAGLPILEGYGLTETSPVLTVNPLEAIRPGTVGKPIPGVEIRVAEDGEILARGPNVMRGYYNLPEETSRALEDGWFHTGDIGHIDHEGYLVITDRKKDLIVTAGGKNVAPQPIENKLKSDKYIAEIVVVGDRRPYLSALIVPNFDSLTSYARFKQIPFEKPSDLARDPAVLDLLKRRIAQAQEGAASFETIKKIHVLDRDFEIGDELTPTLKVKRKTIIEEFHDEIESMYTEN